MGKIILAAGGLWLFWLAYAVGQGEVTDIDALGGLLRSAIFVAMVTAGWLAIRGIKALWRASRRVSVDTVARTAGTLTGAVEKHVSRAAQAFKDGRGH